MKPDAFGEMLKAERLRRGLSLRRAADEIGISTATLHRLERGAADFPVLRAMTWIGGLEGRASYQTGYVAGLRAAQGAVGVLIPGRWDWGKP